MNVKRALWRLKAIGADWSRTTLVLATDIVSYAETRLWKTDSERLEKVGDLVNVFVTARARQPEAVARKAAPTTHPCGLGSALFREVGGRVQSELAWFIPDDSAGRSRPDGAGRRGG